MHMVSLLYVYSIDAICILFKYYTYTLLYTLTIIYVYAIVAVLAAMDIYYINMGFSYTHLLYAKITSVSGGSIHSQTPFHSGCGTDIFFHMTNYELLYSNNDVYQEANSLDICVPNQSI